MASGNRKTGSMRYLIVAVFVVGAFFGAYRFAAARSATADAAPATDLIGAIPASDAPATPGCSCCGSTAPTENGITGQPVERSAAVEGDVQRISVDLSKGYYDPNVIVLTAGVPAEITFGQSSGCTAQVVSEQLGFSEDLTAGPRVVSLPALEAGEYGFSCGMAMVFGKIVVK